MELPTDSSAIKDEVDDNKKDEIKQKRQEQLKKLKEKLSKGTYLLGNIY